MIPQVVVLPPSLSVCYCCWTVINLPQSVTQGELRVMLRKCTFIDLFILSLINLYLLPTENSQADVSVSAQMTPKFSERHPALKEDLDNRRQPENRFRCLGLTLSRSQTQHTGNTRKAHLLCAVCSAITFLKHISVGENLA